MRALLLALLATTVFLSDAQACVNSVRSTPEFLEVCASSDSCRRVNVADLDPGSDAKRSAQLQETLQAFLDVRQPLSALEPEDSDKAFNPDRGDLFWSDADGVERATTLDGATHLTGRACVVTILGFDRGADKFSIKVSRSE